MGPPHGKVSGKFLDKIGGMRKANRTAVLHQGGKLAINVTEEKESISVSKG